ncbi:AAA family ATPase [Rossellomorea sp. NPDC071047]|uniref:AAA family ATPase n=1 Tax=Rossellomorea sp. NPDC071047 TaxID=3390675 RepID=UPI003CFFB0AB
MEGKTGELIEELSEVLLESKYLLLKGGSGVGKTYISKKIAENLKQHVNFFQNKSETEVFSEVVSVHQSYSYEDLIFGIEASADKNNKIIFEFKDKIYLKMLKNAISSWDNKENKKYVLILDDINRGILADILGETLMLLEPHGNKKYSVTLKNGEIIWIPPNFYIIATLNNAIDTPFSIDFAIQRRFYNYIIESDFDYIKEELIDTEAHEYYRKINKLIIDNLTHQYGEMPIDRKKFEIGHGYFTRDFFKKIKYQILPLLRSYCNDGILTQEANLKITALENEFHTEYTTNLRLLNNNRIQYTMNGVTQSTFFNEGDSHKPLINLIGRIKEQELLSDTDIERNLLFNDNIIIREKTISGITYSANLYGSVEEKRHLLLGKRALYKKRSKDDEIYVNNVPYYVAGEMQPPEYVGWDDEFLDIDYKNYRQSTSPNIILFLIIKNYYQAYIMNCSGYLELYDDSEIELLRDFAIKEFDSFKDIYQKIKPSSSKALQNREANAKVRKSISKLILLWKNIGDTIENEDGLKVTVKGVYRVNTENKYKEYIDTMDTLGIRQIILQGPPGTSKTYSTKELLMHISSNKTDLDKVQIRDYKNEKYCELIEVDDNPEIAWDIVQFHPSYGYEDFIRGIEVKTKEKSVVYDTVNKVLGNIAELANKSKKANKKTKFFLIIDEINRANLATVFGELIYGLEYREEGVATPYIVNETNKLVLPDNLYIIGTMNTADKSIGGIDYAIRRRFLFFSLLPDESVILNYRIPEGTPDEERESDESLKQQNDLNKKALNLFKNVSHLFSEKLLNPEYFKEDVQLGHTYFLVEDEEQLYKRFKYQIIPILREYMKDGLFLIEDSSEGIDGWNGFVNYITGKVNVEIDEVALKDIFQSLIQDIDK